MKGGSSNRKSLGAFSFISIPRVWLLRKGSDIRVPLPFKSCLQRRKDEGNYPFSRRASSAQLCAVTLSSCHETFSFVSWVKSHSRNRTMQLFLFLPLHRIRKSCQFETLLLLVSVKMWKRVHSHTIDVCLRAYAPLLLIGKLMAHPHSARRAFTVWKNAI